MAFSPLTGGQFIDVIDYVDDSGKILVHKYERPGDEIKQGSKLIVREGQVAAFLVGGRLADLFGPGTFSLNTKNLPILSSLSALPYGFKSPIKADLYLINTKQFLDNKWGTKNPLILRDEEFGMVRLRGFGAFAFRIIDPTLFIREVLAARHLLKTYDVIEYLTSLVTEAFTRVIGDSGASILDLSTQYREYGAQITEAANTLASPLGFGFTSVIIENISLPEEVEKLIDEQSGIGMATKNMDAFMQYQSARAMRDAAQQEGGLAGIGAGVALGNSMMQEVARPQKGEPEKDPVEHLKQMKELLDAGVLTQEEFDAKKKEILGL